MIRDRIISPGVQHPTWLFREDCACGFESFPFGFLLAFGYFVGFIRTFKPLMDPGIGFRFVRRERLRNMYEFWLSVARRAAEFGEQIYTCEKCLNDVIDPPC